MREELRVFFNERADIWDDIQEIQAEKIERLLSYLPIAKGGVILDVGSGTGVLIPFLRKLFMPSLIVEIDIAENMLAVARRKFGSDGILYIWGDAESYEFDRSFDAIICYSSFPHFENKEGLISHLVSFLKEGGIFAVVHSSGRDTIHRIHALNEVTKNDLLPAGDELAKMFEKRGLEVFKVIDTEDEYVVAGLKGAKVKFI
ncbi:MAG: class I SAM-dependent methyltransferase [Synergistetes bacterium]|nr:class I SAM-dependent methyltransferase [Synergistota bacterium]MDK2871806.1 hypothetical protein [bacterium]